MLPAHCLTSLCVCILSSVRLCSSMDCGCQAPEFRQEYWSGFPFATPGDLSWPRDGTFLSCISWFGRKILYQLRYLGSPGSQHKEPGMPGRGVGGPRRPQPTKWDGGGDPPGGPLTRLDHREACSTQALTWRPGSRAGDTGPFRHGWPMCVLLYGNDIIWPSRLAKGWRKFKKMHLPENWKLYMLEVQGKDQIMWLRKELTTVGDTIWEKRVRLVNQSLQN